MATDIPTARKQLREAMDILRDIGTLESAEAVRLILTALSKMKRKQRNTNRRIISKKITAEIVQAVNHQFLLTPYLTDLEVGAMFKINPGRVNEIRNKLRTEEKPTMTPNRDGYNRTLADLKEAAQ